jgi:hypothetical protein
MMRLYGWDPKKTSNAQQQPAQDIEASALDTLQEIDNYEVYGADTGRNEVFQYDAQEDAHGKIIDEIGKHSNTARIVLASIKERVDVARNCIDMPDCCSLGWDGFVEDRLVTAAALCAFSENYEQYGMAQWPENDFRAFVESLKPEWLPSMNMSGNQLADRFLEYRNHLTAARKLKPLESVTDQSMASLIIKPSIFPELEKAKVFAHGAPCQFLGLLYDTQHCRYASGMLNAYQFAFENLCKAEPEITIGTLTKIHTLCTGQEEGICSAQRMKHYGNIFSPAGWKEMRDFLDESAKSYQDGTVRKTFPTVSRLCGEALVGNCMDSTGAMSWLDFPDGRPGVYRYCRSGAAISDIGIAPGLFDTAVDMIVASQGAVSLSILVPAVPPEEGRAVFSRRINRFHAELNQGGDDISKKKTAVIRLAQDIVRSHLWLDGNGRTAYIVLAAVLSGITQRLDFPYDPDVIDACSSGEVIESLCHLD